MGECIQRLREEKGYSIEELAGLTLSSLEELRKIENGTQQPDKMTLTLLSNVLNVYPDSLQNGEIQRIRYRDKRRKTGKRKDETGRKRRTDFAEKGVGRIRTEIIKSAEFRYG